MIESIRSPVQQSKRATRLRQGALIALRVLETCPLAPVDAFVHLAGLSSQSSAYQQLARLRHAGLAEPRRVNPGYLVGKRGLGCWAITDEGSRALTAALGQNPPGLGVLPHRNGPLGLRSGSRLPDGELPLLIATYRLLASLMLERAAGGKAVWVEAWEWPWVREAWSAAEDGVLRVRMPAGATLRLRHTVVSPDLAAEHSMSVVLVPDLGTAPVVRYREMLRRLVTLCERGMLASTLDGAQLEIVVGTPDPDGMETRSQAWREQLDSVVRRHGADALRIRVLTWDHVAEVLNRTRGPELVANNRPRRATGLESSSVVRSPAPARTDEQMLHLLGRHPCLTVHQLALLLGTGVDRIRRLQRGLIEDGLVRRIWVEELPRGASPFGCDEFAALGLVEITIKGRRRAAGWLGLKPTSASRYHGLHGDGRRDAGRRWRLLRAIRHTLGANEVFVAFAVAAEAARRAGGDDQLAEWRSAAACERRQCKPDGYGCYVRNGMMHGFFLEFDRGTESRRKYATKFGAYYRYRDSSDAKRDYDGFPTLLFVTTEPVAEERIAEEALRALLVRSTAALPVLTTTTERIIGDEDGVLGPIWRTPECTTRRRWLPRIGMPQWST